MDTTPSIEKGHWMIVGHVEGADDIALTYSNLSREDAICRFKQDAIADCDDAFPDDEVIIVAVAQSSTPITLS